MDLIRKYEVLPPTEFDLSGFKPGITMVAKHALSGSDLGVDSHWTILTIEKTGNVVFRPLSARSDNHVRSRPLTGTLRLHSTKSYFEPKPFHKNANI